MPNAIKSTMGPRNRGPLPAGGEPAPAPPKKVIGHGYFGDQPHAVQEPAPPAAAAANTPKPPAQSVASTVAMTKGAMSGFADELVKEAGLRDVLQRIFHGKGGGAAKKLGFFERRRIAKGLGVRPHQVEKTLEHRQRVGRAARGASILGAAAVGGMAGAHLSKENADE